MSNGDLAIGLFNLSDTNRELTIQFWDLGFLTLPHSTVYVRLPRHKELGTFKERFAVTVPSCDCMVVRAKLV
ncbi:MAG: hypothetical protein ACLSD6_02935 [Clostridium sp.]